MVYRQSSGNVERTDEVRVVHSSDLHLRDTQDGGNVDVLRAVLASARSLEAHMTVLVGDVFDHNRVSDLLIAETLEALSEAHAPVVILPGNHDSLGPGSVYARGDFQSLPSVQVIGLLDEAPVVLHEHDLEVWGRPHVGYGDLRPLESPAARTARWRVAAAHGHWVTHEGDLRRSYLIHREHLSAVDADYVALGHWDHWVQVSSDDPPAYYSGAPAFARTVNLVRLRSEGNVIVSREAISTLRTEGLHR